MQKKSKLTIAEIVVSLTHVSFRTLLTIRIMREKKTGAFVSVPWFTNFNEDSITMYCRNFNQLYMRFANLEHFYLLQIILKTN